MESGEAKKSCGVFWKLKSSNYHRPDVRLWKCLEKKGEATNLPTQYVGEVMVNLPIPSMYLPTFTIEHQPNVGKYTYHTRILWDLSKLCFPEIFTTKDTKFGKMFIGHPKNICSRIFQGWVKTSTREFPWIKGLFACECFILSGTGQIPKISKNMSDGW